MGQFHLPKNGHCIPGCRIGQRPRGRDAQDDPGGARPGAGRDRGAEAPRGRRLLGEN